MKKIKNNILFVLYTAILGVIAGIIVWSFMKVMNCGIELIWNFVPSKIAFPFYTLCICTAGGLLIGLWKKKNGDYPQKLMVVLMRVKKTGRYPYKNIFSIIISAPIPLLIGASIGPEAGLTGIIAGLCTWVGDKLKRYQKEADELMAARKSMFSFTEPTKPENDVILSKRSKIVLYLTAISGSVGIFVLLNKLTGTSSGIERMQSGEFPIEHYLYALPLALIGILTGYLFFSFEKLTSMLENKLKSLVIIRAVSGGLILGVSGTFLPLTMFSGEHQISVVTSQAETIGVLMLFIIAAVKLLLTNICIGSGLKGGHFFPVIFCGICIGCAMSLLLNTDMVFCCAVVTAAVVGHILKKPLITVLLLIIIFPIKLAPVMLFSAAAAKFIPTPSFLLPKMSDNLQGGN